MASIYTGLSYPFIITNGTVALTILEELIEASIRHIISYAYGTRFFMPKFGCLTEQLLKEPNDIITKDMAVLYLTEAISTYEKRVTLKSIIVEVLGIGKLSIKLQYVIKNTTELKELLYVN